MGVPFTAQISLDAISSEAGDIVTIEVADQNDQSNCRATNTVDATVPRCPPCPQPGDLVITEIFKNSDSDLVPDSLGDWFEILNISAETINLFGLTLSDDDNDEHVIDENILLLPGEYAVLSRNADSTINGGFFSDYAFGNDFILGNDDDEIVISCSGTEIDRVNYDDDNFPDNVGASIQLDPDSLTATANDNGSNFCTGIDRYGDGIGTPGEANVPCPTAPSNDLCSGAIELSDGVTIMGTTIGATDDEITDTPCFDADDTPPGVWYTYTPINTGNLRLEVCADSTLTFSVWAFSGTCDSLFCEEGEDDECSTGGIANMPVVAGVQYFFLINANFGNPPGDFDDFEFTVTEVSAPANDNCVDAIMVELGEMVTASSENAASENDITYTGTDCEAPLFGDNDDQGVWYSFVAPEAPVSVMVMGFVGIEMSVLAGTCDSLDCIASVADTLGTMATIN
ncbi:MAG: lamin tail domain-containing protein, partial [Bacteroidota bacterium]